MTKPATGGTMQKTPGNRQTAPLSMVSPFSPRILDHYSACPDCDLLLYHKNPPPGYTLLCPRCGRAISRGSANAFAKVLALSLSGLLLYPPAMLLPLISLNSFGFSGSANILESILNFYRNDFHLVAVMTLLAAVVFPLLLLAASFFFSLRLLRPRPAASLERWKVLLRLYLHLEEWAMVEVYLIGILVTIIKMSGTAEIAYGPGIWCFAVLVVISLAISVIVDRHLFWQAMDGAHAANEPPEQESPAALPENISAAELGLILCHTCHALSPDSEHRRPCRRCQAILHARKPQSRSRTWALVATSAILFLPANLLPIMEVDFLGVPERSTILDGILYFFKEGSYFIGVIILTASILVPIFKIVGLVILLLASDHHPDALTPTKTKLYRFITFIGRWSMLDIFVIALLSVLVDFGFFTSIHTAPAATYFALVVAATMLAATTFDPRSLWDGGHHPLSPDKLPQQLP